MIYVMTDIHGCHDLFQEMLRAIHFSYEDDLYILGDFIDQARAKGFEFGVYSPEA